MTHAYEKPFESVSVIRILRNTAKIDYVLAEERMGAASLIIKGRHSTIILEIHNENGAQKIAEELLALCKLKRLRDQGDI